MEIVWMSAFFNLAEDRLQAGVDFWSKALSCQVSPWRGDHGEFATLLPQQGDSYVRLQRTLDGSTGMHLDLHVASPELARDRALQLGAELVADRGYFTMRSPSGLQFCFVSDGGERVIPPPSGDSPYRFDQVCIDVAASVYDAEAAFWHELTEWPLDPPMLSEYRSLDRPPQMPLRLLVQRLDEVHEPRQPHAHADISCGEHVDEVAQAHVALGAKQLGRTKVWMQMEDPAGLQYCLTPRPL